MPIRPRLRPEDITPVMLWDLFRRWLATAAIELANTIMPADGGKDDDVLPRSRLVKATFMFEVPRPASRAQIEEWLSFNLNSGSLGKDNPLFDEGLEAAGQMHLEDTGEHLHLRIYRHDGALHVQKLIESTPYGGPSVTDIATHEDHPAIIDAPPPWLRSKDGKK